MGYHETGITVRFNEIDAYRVAWHGHYVAWIEIGRTSLAGQFGLDPDQLSAAGFLGPVVDLRVDWHEDPIAELRHLWTLYAPPQAAYGGPRRRGRRGRAGCGRTHPGRPV